MKDMMNNEMVSQIVNIKAKNAVIKFLLLLYKLCTKLNTNTFYK